MNRRVSIVLLREILFTKGMPGSKLNLPQIYSMVLCGKQCKFQINVTKLSNFPSKSGVLDGFVESRGGSTYDPNRHRPPFWQINHANSAYFRLFLGYFRVILATRPPPPFWISAPLFTYSGFAPGREIVIFRAELTIKTARKSTLTRNKVGSFNVFRELQLWNSSENDHGL